MTRSESTAPGGNPGPSFGETAFPAPLAWSPRKAGLRDLRLLAELNIELIHGESCEVKMSLQGYEDRMQRWLDHGMHAVLAEVEGDAAAYALYFEDGENVFIRHFLVREPYRRRGLGGSFFRYLIREVLPEKPLIAEALASNPPALAFWRSLGFQNYYIGFRRETGPAAEHG